MKDSIECKVEFLDNLDIPLEIKIAELKIDERGKIYNRAKEKENVKKEYNKYLEERGERE